ncbi:MAG: fused MFS/spermidine synthase [Acidobacteriota bacterium]
MPLSRVAPLLFASGFCALVFQVAWLRLLRLIFGGSTAASAATLAMFMAGLGLGSLVLSRRVDRWRRPLLGYAKLEAGVAMAAALSPWLVGLAQSVYFGLGGASELGDTTATLLRLALSALVLGVPTFLMGGTLPAASLAVATPNDRGRRRVALLYGINTLGAVCGALVATFFALEHLGIRGTLWTAAGLNLGVALVAALLGRTAVQAKEPDEGSPATEATADPAAARGRFVLGAAAVVGFAFFLMEMVWYRILAPVLGGSSYTFGLILAIALLGVGLGGWLYSQVYRHRARDQRPTLVTFAGTCAAEALLLLVPYALGDHIALTAMLLRPIGNISFALLVASWTALTAVVVLPAAIVAGFQFPLLIALLGSGRRHLGRQVGLAYACNTVGAVAGAIAGGFGLLALLSAPRLWLGVAGMLLVLAAVAVALERPQRFERRLLWPAIAAPACLALMMTPGPSALWRHTPIGAGGMPASFDGPNEVRRISHAVKRAIGWQREGRESSIAIHGLDEASLLVNGKADGSAVSDAPTQVLSVLIGAALHPAPRDALVIGLGTGSSAGWLAKFPGIESVRVVELEPAMTEVSELCAAVNHDALDLPQVKLQIGDGRELLRSSPATYDLIFSEPSNPYRAGIASLFTRNLYRDAARRLNEGGIFLQWLQSYHVDADLVRTVVATLASELPHVEIWQLASGDMLLAASPSPIRHNLARIRGLAAEEPLRSALRATLGVSGAEGFYTAFIASDALAKAMSRQVEELNTDDHPIVEFGFARGVGRDLGFSVQRLLAVATTRREQLPPIQGGRLDWRRVLELRTARDAKWGALSSPLGLDEAMDTRIAARNAYVLGDLVAAGRRWQSQPEPPSSPLDQLLVAEALAEAADPAALEHAEQLQIHGQVGAAHAVRARFYVRAGLHPAALDPLIAVFRQARTNPWTHRPTLERSLALAAELAQADPVLGLDLFPILGDAFAVQLLDEARLRIRLDIAEAVSFAAFCEPALAPFKPHVPWEEDFLERRSRCYETLAHPLMEQAREDLATYQREAAS